MFHPNTLRILVAAAALSLLAVIPAGAAGPKTAQPESFDGSQRENLREALKPAGPAKRLQQARPDKHDAAERLESPKRPGVGESPTGAGPNGARVNSRSALFDQEVRIQGAPPPPTLVNPASGATINDACLIFSWSPGSGNTPAGTTYRVEVWEQGTRRGQAPTDRFPSTPSGASGTSLSGCLQGGFQGARLRWSVRACAPDPNAPRLAGAGPPMRCGSSPERPLVFALPTPQLGSPAQNTEVGLRPTFSLDRSVLGAERTIFCLARPGASCPSAPTSLSAPDAVVQEVSGRNFRPSSDLSQFAGDTLNWTAAVCARAVGCSAWASPRPVRFTGFAPVPELIGTLNFTYATSPNHTFEWSVPSSQFVDFYKFCLTTANGSCDPGQAIAVWDLRSTRKRLNIRDNSGLAPHAGQALKWTVAACNTLGCSWQESRTGTLIFPHPPMQPTWIGPLPGTYVPQHHIQVTLDWNAALGADYYVPCVREVNGRCGADNEIFDAHVNSGGSSCMLRGPYPYGHKIAQIAACNEVWGCRWSAPQPSPNIVFNMAGTYSGNQTRFTCR